MFVQSTEACSLPNSESPMSQSEIDGQNAFVANVGTAFDDGDDALNALIQALGGNPAGDTGTGAAGVPTTGTLDTYLPGIPVVPTAPGTPPLSMLPSTSDPSSWAWAPSPWPAPWGWSDDPSENAGGGPGYGQPGQRWANSPGAPIIVSGGGSGWRAPQGEHQLSNRRRYRNGGSGGTRSRNAPQSSVPGNCPVIVPLITTIPIPTTVPVSAPTATPTATPGPVIPPPTLPDCRTGNWCLDIRRGCVLSSQVSQEQLEACSAAGYAGNLNSFPAIAAAGGVLGGQYFGTPDPNPGPYSPGLGQTTAQTVNTDIFSNALEYVIAGLVTVAAMAILSKGRKK
jgi:hypothetical protein